MVILITFSLSAYSTSFKWVVYFNDKPQVNFNPHTYFSEKAIERRIKHHLPLYTYSDLPVNENYVAEIASGVVDTKGVSRWLNCVFIYANYEQVESLKNLHYVARVEQLNSSAQLAKATVDKNLNENLTPEELRKKQLNRLGYDYFKGNKIDGSGVRVAIFDAGFPYVNAHSAFNHLFKNNRVIATYDFVKNKESVYGANSHGAQCLSNICGMIGDKPIGLATGIEVLLARTERVLTEALKEEENWLLAAEWADKNGDLGPVYGAQWTNWKRADGKLVNQIQDVVHSIRTNPDSRRHIVCAWNPGELHLMALPPCHALFQFYVSNGKLSCQLYQRSADIFLGVPFNIASYSILTMMVAKICGLQAYEFIHTFGDLHLYANHKEQAELQLDRNPRSLPKMHIHGNQEELSDFKFEDFELINYDPYPAIKAPIAI